MASAADLLGGVEAEITEAASVSSSTKFWRITTARLGLAADDGLLETAGEHLLNGPAGPQLLPHPQNRQRIPQRTGRQQRIIESAAEKLTQMQLFDLLKLAVTLLDEVETDLTLADLAALAPLLGCETLDIQGRACAF